MKKKFTMLFAALLACVGVMAQISALTELDNSKAYLLKNANDMGYAIWKSGDNLTLCGATSTYTDALDATVANNNWQIISYNDKYYLYNVGAEKFAVTQGGPTYLTSTPTPIAIESVSKGFAFNSDGDAAHYMCASHQGHHAAAPIQFWYSNDNGSAWQIIENENVASFQDLLKGATVVEDYFNSQVPVVFEYYIDGELYHTSEAVNHAKNISPEIPALAFVNVVDCDVQTITEACTVKVNCTEKLPFTVSASSNDLKWQLVEMHRNGTFRVWDYVANDAAVNVTELSTAKECVVDDSKLWAFTGSLIDGFKIYNKLAGTSVTLNATATNPKVGVAANGNDVWKLVQSTANSDAAVAWCFTNNGTDYMNRNGEGQIAYWDEADNGSTMYSYGLSELAQMVIDAASMVLNIPEGVVGSYLIAEDVLADLNAKTEAAKADVANFEKVQALSAAVKAAKESDQVAYADGYYRIFSAQSGLYANSKGVIYDTADDKFKWNTVANDNVNAIVKLSTVDGKVVMQNANSNRYMQGVLGASNTNKGTNSGITLVALGGAQYNLSFGNGTMHANNHGNGTGAGSDLINYGGAYGSASAWYLFPATELEITINEFASICLPFNVVPGEDVKVYAIEETNGTQAILVEKEDIPAGEGAILEGNGTVKLNLATASSDWEKNLLEGTTVNTNINEAAYVLAKPEGKEIGLYSAKLTEGSFLNNANKAYLPASEVSNTGAPMFSFSRGDDETTSIDNVKLINDNVVIYDLLGRCVEKMEKGIYIVNGKKVIR